MLPAAEPQPCCASATISSLPADVVLICGPGAMAGVDLGRPGLAVVAVQRSGRASAVRVIIIQAVR